MEALVQYGKEKHKTVKDVHNELMYNVYNAPMSKWNIGNITQQFLTSKVDESIEMNVTENNELTTSEEKRYRNKLLSVYRFFDVEYAISDWSTKNIGTSFIRTAMERYGIQDFDDIHDAFTSPDDNVSWPDIAVMYNLKDFRVLNESESILITPAKYTEPEVCDDWDFFCIPGFAERYSSFQSCFENVMAKIDKSFDGQIFKKEYRTKKIVQHSPCSDLEQFPTCMEYCTWHENYFRTSHKAHFIQAMSYAGYQRKVFKDSMPHEKEIAGKKFNAVYNTFWDLN